MSVTNKVSVYIFTIVFILTCVFVVHTVFSKVATFELIEKAQVQVIKNVYDGFPQTVYSIIDKYHRNFVNNKELMQAFKDGKRGLFASFGQNIFNQFSEEADRLRVNIHVHNKNGLTFYRFHKPEYFGDSLIEVRPMIKKVFTEKKVVKGFEIGKSGLFQRVAYTIFDQNEFLGIIEFGVDINYFSSKINSITNIKTSLLIKHEYIKDFNDFFYYFKVDDKYMVFNNDPELFAKLNEMSLDNRYYTVGKKYYSTMKGFPLKNFNGENIGEFLFILDRTELMHWIFNYVIKVAVLFFISLIIIYYIVRNKIKPMVSDVENNYLEANRELERINKDLEKRVEIMIEKNRQNEELMHSRNKLADMGRMINALAHHWRQPLNALGLYVQDVTENVKEGNVSDEYIDEFRKESMGMIKQLSSTIDDFRSFFKSESSDDPEFEIIHRVINILRLMKSQLDNNYISLDVSCTCDNSTFECGENLNEPECLCTKYLIKGYKTEFKQVILSIINNSIDAIIDNRKAGAITNGELKFRVIADSNMINLLISDNGGGISASVAGNIFDPYFSTKQEGKGAGLGLYNAKVIIEQQFGGEINFKNTDVGAEFIISIPTARRPS
ncbi:MAG: hypothetical protein C0602_01060 [Denitrovibrio sp.]|nr:MAG: hypothetical protein C0602_01060 [Denitrovibrio sp.]